MLRSEVATSSVEKPLFMGDFGNFNYKFPKNQFSSSLTDSPLSKTLLIREGLPFDSLKIMIDAEKHSTPISLSAVSMPAVS